MYFFLSFAAENHRVESIQRAERTAMIGVSIPRSSPRPPKNSTKPPNGMTAVGIPIFFIHSSPVFRCEVSLGYPCITKRVPIASLRRIEVMSRYWGISTEGFPPRAIEFSSLLYGEVVCDIRLVVAYY